jgi:hypothetical protein
VVGVRDLGMENGNRKKKRVRWEAERMRVEQRYIDI